MQDYAVLSGQGGGLVSELVPLASVARRVQEPTVPYQVGATPAPGDDVVDLCFGQIVREWKLTCGADPALRDGKPLTSPRYRARHQGVQSSSPTRSGSTMYSPYSSTSSPDAKVYVTA